MRVGIIGGGATGLAAAYDLSQLGHNVSAVSYTHLTLPTSDLV